MRGLIALVLWLGVLAFGYGVLLCGCAAPPAFDPTAVDGSDHELGPDQDDPGAVCLSDVPPCVGVAYCDELGASEQPACDYTADGSCRRWNVAAGLSCFPAVDGPHTGFCDGAGVCR